MRPVQLVPLGSLLLLAACVVTPPVLQVPVDEGTVKKGNQTNLTGQIPAEVLNTPTPAPAGSLVGTVLAPAGIVAASGMNLVAAGSLNLVAAGGLNAVAPGAASYRLGRRRLLSLAQEPVGGASVQLFDAQNRSVADAVVTEAKTGRYIFPKLPAGSGPFVLKVGVKTATGNAVLETIVRPTEAPSADVDVATTMVTAAVLARSGGKLEFVNTREFKRAVSNVSSVVSDDALPDLTKPQALVDAVAAIARTSSELRNAIAVLAGEARPTAAPSAAASGSPVPGASGSPGASTDPNASASPAASASPGDQASAGPTPLATASPPVITGLTSLRTASLFAGTDTSGFKDGARLDANFKAPVGVTVDPQGYVYTCDLTNHLVRRIDPGTNGKVSTLAGLAGTAGTAADTATGVDARFSFPFDLVATSDTTLFILDKGNRVIRKLTHANGESVTVTKFSGKGTEGFTEGAATECQYTHPVAIAFDGVNTLFVSDYTDTGVAARILAIDATTGAMSLFAGGAEKGSKDGPVATARFGRPGGLAVRTVDGKREVWVADQGFGNIRRIAETDAGLVVSTPAGPVEPASEAFGERNTLPLSEVRFQRPGRMSFTPDGDLLILDTSSGGVRWMRFRDGEPFEVRSLQPPPGSGITTPFKIEGTTDNMGGIAFSPVTKSVFVTMGSLARIREIR